MDWSFSPRSWRQTVDATDEGHHLDPIEEAGERVDSGCAVTVAGPRWTSSILNGHSGIAPSIEVEIAVIWLRCGAAMVKPSKRQGKQEEFGVLGRQAGVAAG
jgi:hypothetical protein